MVCLLCIGMGVRVCIVCVLAVSSWLSSILEISSCMSVGHFAVPTLSCLSVTFHWAFPVQAREAFVFGGDVARLL